MTKDEVCFDAAKKWLIEHPAANPEFSTACGMIFNDNEDADDIGDAIVAAGEAADYWIEPFDVANAALKAKESLSA